MRIAVLEGLALEKHRALLEQRQDRLLGLAHRHAREVRHRRLVAAGIVDRLVEREVILHAHLEILDAVRGRRVNQPRAGFERDVLRQDDRHEAILEGMAQLDALELTSERLRERLAFDAVALERGIHQVRGEDQQPTRGGHQRILDLRADRDRAVAGKRPRRGGPDHGELRMDRKADAEGLREMLALRHREGHIDRGRCLVLVLDFGFSERRAAVDAPVARFEAPISQPVLPDAADRTDLGALGRRVHGAVRVFPVAQDAEALEIFFLALDLLGGVGAAERALVIGFEVAAVLLLDLVLDRQPVAVPAGSVGRVEAGHRLGLDHQVLEDLVDCVPDVDVAVGVGRAVVEHVQGPALGGGAKALVEARLAPTLDPRGLAPCEVPAHRESRLGEIQRALVVDLRVVRHQGLVARKKSRAASQSRPIWAASSSSEAKFASSRSFFTNSMVRRRP